MDETKVLSLASFVTGRIHALVAVVAQNDVGLVAADPARRHRGNSSAAALAVLVIPHTFPKCKPVSIESAALVKDHDSVTARNGIPPSESAPAPQLDELRIWRRTIRNERLQSVKGRNPALVILMSAQFLEFVIHALSGLSSCRSATSGAYYRSAPLRSRPPLVG
jgi:hypothetical protein